MSKEKRNAKANIFKKKKKKKQKDKKKKKKKKKKKNHEKKILPYNEKMINEK